MVTLPKQLRLQQASDFSTPLPRSLPHSFLWSRPSRAACWHLRTRQPRSVEPASAALLQETVQRLAHRARDVRDSSSPERLQRERVARKESQRAAQRAQLLRWASKVAQTVPLISPSRCLEKSSTTSGQVFSSRATAASVVPSAGATSRRSAKRARCKRLLTASTETHHLRDLGGREAFHIAEDEYLTVQGFEPVDGLLQRNAHLLTGGLCFRAAAHTGRRAPEAIEPRAALAGGSNLPERWCLMRGYGRW